MGFFFRWSTAPRVVRARVRRQERDGRLLWATVSCWGLSRVGQLSAHCGRRRGVAAAAAAAAAAVAMATAVAAVAMATAAAAVAMATAGVPAARWR